VVPAELHELMYRTDKNGRRRILRSVYECGVFQTLREKLRWKEIWVQGADKWRNPDEDLPTDFEANRAENYRKVSKPLDPKKFVSELREEMDAELSALLIYGAGTNTGVRVVAAGDHPHSEEDLRYTRRRFSPCPRCGKLPA
jgi:hypothetical protein